MRSPFGGHLGRRVPGTGPLGAKIVIIGEAAGADEERLGLPFVGASGPVVFDSQGRITDTAAHVVRHDGTRFRTVANYKKPLPPMTAARERSPQP